MGLFDRLRGGSESRVVFLGIDGVPYDLVDDHPDVFPNLTAIAADGTGGQIESIVPPESSACWPSLTTGQNPGQTGVYGFQDRERDSYKTYVPMGNHVSKPRIWDLVTDAGRDASVFNVPVTFPPSPRIQRHVTGFLSPSVADATSSDELRATLERYNYQIDVNAKLGHDDNKTAFIENAHDVLDARQETFTHYLAQDDWDLFFGVYMTTDRVNHFLLGDYVNDTEYADDFLEFYRTLDEYIGGVREMLDDDTELIIASDHGFTELEYEVNCNQWLADEGWLSYSTEDHDKLGDIGADARAYSLIPGRFFLNLEGREPEGIVAESDYEQVRDELIADLEGLTGPDGRQVCRRIVKGEDAFNGDQTAIAPDLVVIPTDGYDLKAGFKQKADIFSKGPRNGMHKFENACLFSTSDELDLSDANLFDLTPTILDLLEIEEPESMDGNTLTN